MHGGERDPRGGGPDGPAREARRDGPAVLLGFARALREAGVAASPERVQAMFAAADALGVAEASGIYWAGRVTLCAEPDDLPTYDAAFAAYFGGGALPRHARRTASTPRDAMPHRLTVPFGVEGPDTPREDVTPRRAEASDIEVLRRRDLVGLSAAERDEVRRLLTLLRPVAAQRRSRRRRPAPRGEIDPPRTVRWMLRNGGEPARLARRTRRLRPRRLVLLVDVSGSMAPYADALVRFAHAAVRVRPRATEAFTLGTRLTRITRPLRLRDPAAAVAACGRAIPDWSGGTRLGEALKVFLDRWGRRGVARQSVVVVFSDGWERGDPALLAEQMGLLARLAHRVVWVNPHKGTVGYAPLVGGMAAALPHVDDFVTGHSFAALEELVEVIADA